MNENALRLTRAMGRFSITIESILEQCAHLNQTVKQRQLKQARWQVEAGEGYTPLKELERILGSEERLEKLCRVLTISDLKAVVIECDFYHLFQYLYTTGAIDVSMKDLEDGVGVSRVIESQTSSDQESSEQSQTGVSEKLTIKNMGSGRRIEMFHQASRIASKRVCVTRLGKQEFVWRYTKPNPNPYY